MSEYLPREVREGLEQARRRDAKIISRLRVHSGDQVFRILSMTEEGFTLEGEKGLRGFVEIYEGNRPISQCLIVRADSDGDEVRYIFKRRSPIRDSAALDFAEPDNKPAGFLPRH
ncbi:hypothetical protein [Pseudoruegeria sp. SHC-113]|uniref:hypothetical protein n=1 Tax=Pseudoruegeria sp. SHC-113 TaxID=2855439 RepID=UPI0021BAC52E|nr:hypothetical protein [Pseudoruegeria sp. SHC-113]MCT8159212.1 hypothetical protein [Pseudoruegeria sp. SHC-113]